MAWRADELGVGALRAIVMLLAVVHHVRAAGAEIAAWANSWFTRAFEAYVTLRAQGRRNGTSWAIVSCRASDALVVDGLRAVKPTFTNIRGRLLSVSIVNEN